MYYFTLHYLTLYKIPQVLQVPGPGRHLLLLTAIHARGLFGTGLMGT